LKEVKADLEEEKQRSKAATMTLTNKEKEVRALQGKITGLNHENGRGVRCGQQKHT